MKIIQLLILAITLSVSGCGSSDSSSAPDVGNNTLAAPPSIVTSEAPAGIYVLSNGNSAGNIRDYDFVEGFTLRSKWSDIELSAGVYDFSVIDESLQQLETLDKLLTLEVLVMFTPEHVLDQLSETWLNSKGSSSGVPWDTQLLESWDRFQKALAEHRVELNNGTEVAMADHPNFRQISAPIVGLSGIRDITKTLVTFESYTRQKLIDAMLLSVGSTITHFPKQAHFIAVFSMDDDDRVNPLDEEMVSRLMQKFNSGESPKLGFFQELLSDIGPNPNTGGVFLFNNSSSTYIMFQALKPWTLTLAGEDKVTSGTPSTGIELGFNVYGARYFELYLTDIDNHDLWNELRQWNLLLTDFE